MAPVLLAFTVTLFAIVELGSDMFGSTVTLFAIVVGVAPVLLTPTVTLFAMVHDAVVAFDGVGRCWFRTYGC